MSIYANGLQSLVGATDGPDLPQPGGYTPTQWSAFSTAEQQRLIAEAHQPPVPPPSTAQKAKSIAFLAGVGLLFLAPSIGAGIVAVKYLGWAGALVGVAGAGVTAYFVNDALRNMG